MRDRLAIALRAEAMTALHKIVAEFAVVVDFSIKDEGDRLIFVGERLIATGDIDDAQAAHGQADIAVDEVSGAVGTAMPQPVIHGSQKWLRDRLAVKLDDAADAAHGYGPSLLNAAILSSYTRLAGRTMIRGQGGCGGSLIGLYVNAK